nr:hypothetical protein [uncultured Kingella sp.]
MASSRSFSLDEDILLMDSEWINNLPNKASGVAQPVYAFSGCLKCTQGI